MRRIFGRADREVAPRRGGAHRRPLPKAQKSLLRPLVTGIALLAVSGTGTYGAYTASTPNIGNSISAGSVQVIGNDAGTALFSLAGMRPGDINTRCIKITYTGTLQSAIKFYGATSGTGLDAYLDLKVTRGAYSPSDPGYGSCTNFVADAPDYLGKGAGVVYDGSLQGFADDYATGTADPLTAAPESWVENETHVYKFALTMGDAPPSAQGVNATQSFTWEARNGDGTPYRTAVTGTSGLVHYYRLDETTGTTATDSTGTAHGTYSGSPALGATDTLDADVGTAVSFDKVDDYANLTGLAVNTTAGAYNTVEFWMYWDGTENVMAFGTSGYSLYLINGSFGFNTGVSDVWGTSSAGMTNRWVHVAAEFYNGAGTSSRLWIDGVEHTLSSRYGGASTSRTLGMAARIGTCGGCSNWYFGGKLDEVAVYNRALTSTEILAHYNAR